jgi:DNA-binding response OmpR family regulator/nitrogen-specific signal transduction histidine kinase
MPRRSRLLIVDDNAATRYAMRRTVERQGYTVMEAGNGSDGLDLLAQHEFAAVILDVNLPDMSGFDVVRQLRQSPRTEMMPVIHVSAASIDTGDLAAGLDNGADAYLIHPVDPGVLLATLRTLRRVRESEDALRESEARFREIFSGIGAPIALVDANLVIIEANDAFARMVASPGQDVVALFEDGQGERLDAMRHALAAGHRWRDVLCLRSPMGTRELEWRITPYRGDVGMAFVEDLTEQRQREREHLQQIDTATTQLAAEIAEREWTESQLRQAQKMDALGKLTGGIAHDFNNLLTSIITGIDLINRQVDAGRTGGVQRLADAALASARRAAALTHRLLAFARQQPLDSRPTDINERVRSLADLLHRTIGEKVALSLALDPAPMVAQVDPNQLENAILNLAINARDAMPDGGRIDISSRRLHMASDAELTPGDYVVLTVADTGGGIDPSIIEKVFEPFFTTKPMGKGTGLGLSMIYGFARQSGGVARIESEVGVGTRVSLLLPVTEAEVLPPRGRAEVAEGGHGERVLVVEDTETVRTLVCQVLESAGYQCTATGNVDEALRLIRGDEPIHLLLTDIGMPDMDGRELAQTARAWRPMLPILFMTGYAENTPINERTTGPRMEMITKPFEIDELLLRVRAMFE